MADEIDRAQDREEVYRRAAIAAARRPVPQGTPGKCCDCHTMSQRLVGGRCGYCRDGR
jgi:hypothetical protein